MENFNVFWNSFEKTGHDEEVATEAAKSDHINPRPESWDMLGDGSLVTKSGTVVVAAPNTCEQCDSARSRGQFTGPPHKDSLCDSSCYEHCTKDAHW